jgi:hypothetical protein
MAQNRLITDLVELIQPNNDDLLVIVDNTTDPTLSTTKKITYANLVEDLQDMVDLLITEGNGIVATYSDVGNTITLSVSGDTTIQKSIYSSGGTSIGTRRQLNFIPGAGVTLAGADNSSDNRVDLTVNTTTVATGVTLSGTGSPVSPLESVSVLGNGTKQLNFRGVRAGSNKLSVNTGDGGNTIVVDVVPSGIDINTLNVGSPLAIELGGTNATTASSGRANLGAAQLGVNSDITSLAGLTTPLSIAQGGTNGGTVQLGLRNLEGIRTVVNVGAAGQSLVVNSSSLVSNSYRAELKGMKAGSSKITVTTVGNDISVDANAILILNSATEDINFNDNKITGLSNPSASSDAANKGYVDAVAQGLVVKEAVVAATTVNQTGTYSASGLTFTYTATGTPSIDSVSITATGTRLLLKDQTTGSQNGIYTLTTSGDTGVSPILTRASDYDSSLEASAGGFAFVLSGSANANKQFVQTTLAPTLDTDPLVFTVLNDLTIANGSVTNEKLANMPALRVKGAVTSGVPQDLTADQVITIVNDGTSQINLTRLNLTTISGDVIVNASGISSISSGVIVNDDISPTAEIAVSKLADGIARQLLQTSADGNEVEWASDIVVPGTFNAIGNAVFSGNATIAGTTAFWNSAAFASGVTVSGSAVFASGVTVSGSAVFASGVTVSGSAVFTSGVTVSGAATFVDGVTVSGSAVFASGVTVGGTAAFSGTTTAPTPASGNSSNNVATTAFVGTTISGAIGTTIQPYDVDTAKLDVAQTFSAPQRGTVGALADGATITPDFGVANNFSVTLGGSRTLASPSNVIAGQSGVIVITQDATGNRTLTYGSNWKFAGGVDPTLTTTANAVDVLTYYAASSTVIIATVLRDAK